MPTFPRATRLPTSGATQVGARAWWDRLGGENGSGKSGGSGIRTHGAHHPTVFKTVAFVRSAIPPTGKTLAYGHLPHNFTP